MISQANSKMTVILRTLREELKQGQYEQNSRFPSEYDLAERFGVNKKTARPMGASGALKTSASSTK